MHVELHPGEPALLRVLQLLSARGYAFTTITPASHARVLARRRDELACDLRDVFGWSLPFEPAWLDPELLDALREAEALEQAPAGLKSAVRVSSLRGGLFLHSAYPPVSEHAVFLGPDTHRFLDFVLRELPGGAAPRTILEIGAGTGAAGVLAGLQAPAAHLTLADVNPTALRHARVNAAFAGREVQILQSDGLAAVKGSFDLVIANPPFLVDSQRRTYRDGGGLNGAQMSLDWALAASRRLNPGGRVMLYTGSAIVEGRDRLEAELRARLPGHAVVYAELDPDIFGEELEKPAYAAVERIAAVMAVITAE